MAWLVGKGLELASSLSSGFVPQLLTFGDIQVVTTALLAEGGYSFVYSAREVSKAARTYAVKKVLAQDAEGVAVAEAEVRLLGLVADLPGFVKCFGTTSRPAAQAGAREFWILLEYCPNGSLIDLIYRKNAAGEYERGPPLTQERVLEVFFAVVDAVVRMHELDP